MSEVARKAWVIPRRNDLSCDGIRTKPTLTRSQDYGWSCAKTGIEVAAPQKTDAKKPSDQGTGKTETAFEEIARQEVKCCGMFFKLFVNSRLWRFVSCVAVCGRDFLNINA
jgi:hypothetical protein